MTLLTYCDSLWAAFGLTNFVASHDIVATKFVYHGFSGKEVLPRSLDWEAAMLHVSGVGR